MLIFFFVIVITNSITLHSPYYVILSNMTKAFFGFVDIFYSIHTFRLLFHVKNLCQKKKYETLSFYIYLPTVETVYNDLRWLQETF